MMKKLIKLSSLALFILGTFFLLNSKINITGAVTGGPDISPAFSSVLGIVIIFASVILFVSEESLEERLGIHNFEKDKDYQNLKRDLESKGELVKKEKTEKEEENIIDFGIYKDILEKKLYVEYPVENLGTYRSERGEYFEIKNQEGISTANKYLEERVKEISRDPRRLAELIAMIRNEGKPYDESVVKDRRDKLLKQYTRREIDATEFAMELNRTGEFTGGEFNPGHKHLSVTVMGHPFSIPGRGTDKKLARAIYERILANSPRYNANCEFHFSKKASTKHHVGGL